MPSEEICHEITVASIMFVKYTRNHHTDVKSKTHPVHVIDNSNSKNKVTLGGIAQRIENAAIILRNGFELDSPENHKLAKLFVELSIAAINIKAFSKGGHHDVLMNNTYDTVQNNSGYDLFRIDQEILILSEETYNQLGG